MNSLIISQAIIIALSLYFIVRVASRLPKVIAYSIYGFIATSTAIIFFLGFYHPETLIAVVNTVEGWQKVLKMG